jgi:hypothetical protein
MTGDKDSMFTYYSFPLRVGSDAIQYRIEGAMKRTEMTGKSRSAFSAPAVTPSRLIPYEFLIIAPPA